MRHFTAWNDPTFLGAPDVANVPLCASYCETWFNACKNDKTCIYNGKAGKHITVFQTP